MRIHVSHGYGWFHRRCKKNFAGAILICVMSQVHANAFDKEVSGHTSEAYLLQKQNKVLIKAEDLRQQGLVFLAEGNVPKAIERFTQLVKSEKLRAKAGRSESLADAYHGLGDCYAQTCNDKMAQSAYNSAVSAATNSKRSQTLATDSLVGLGKIAEKQAHYWQAAKFYKQALVLQDQGRHSDTAATWRRYSAVMQRLGKLAESEEALVNAQRHEKLHKPES
ncbi:MAG TPA: tetratricopeptide repeat protein [Drouetiella sp.]